MLSYMDRCYGNIQLYSAAKQSKIQSLSRKAKQDQKGSTDSGDNSQ